MPELIKKYYALDTINFYKINKIKIKAKLSLKITFNYLIK